MHFCDRVQVPIELYVWEALTKLFPGYLLIPVIQAQLTSMIVDKFLTLRIQDYTSHLVGKME